MTGADAITHLDGFDFENYWTATDEYPVLNWQVQDVHLSIDQPTIGEGESTEISVELALDDGSTVTATEVTDIESTESAIATVDDETLTAHNQGETDIAVTVAGITETATVTVVEPPEISLVDTDLVAPAIVDGTPLIASATYENAGGPGTTTAELTIDGEFIESDSVSIDSDASETVTFHWTPIEQTTHDVSIDDEHIGSVDVLEPGTVTLETVDVPDQIGDGAPYEIDLSFENSADVDTLESVIYRLNGDEVEVAPLLIDADGSTNTIEHATEGDGTVTHVIEHGDDTVTGTSEIVDPPAFVISALDVSDEIDHGDSLEVSATIENQGGIQGEQTISVLANGEPTSEDTLSLDVGQREEITTSVDTTEPGTLEIEVESADDIESTTVTVNDVDEAAAGDELPGFGAVVALAALLVAIAIRTIR